ncbi:MAG: hypothetical protein P4L53_06550 [Candidatus Obscuribacterales bacterium]|nr:hypothetical protein [Candidatus Obscuribacterales bacterium]
MSNSQQTSTSETASAKLATFENLMEKSKQALRLPDGDLPFGQAISWLIKAEEVAVEIGENDLQTVSDAYVDLILLASTKCQQLALNCGHILRQHRDLVIAVEAALRRLAGCRRQQTNIASKLPCAVLEAQGHAEQLVKMVSRHIDAGIIYTDAELLNRLMSNLEDIRELIFPLTKKAASDFRSDSQTLNLIGTAVVNASYSINRFFLFLCDYEKAAAFCRWSGMILHDVDNQREFVLGQVDRASLHKALRRAQSSLSTKDFSNSKFHLDQAKKILRTLKAEV